METAINNTSSIIRLDFGNNSFLFTADAQVLKQNRTINQVGVQLKVNVLDIVHHGNSNNDFNVYNDISGDYYFYGFVSPQYAISCTGNDHSSSSKPRPKVAHDLSMAQIYTTRESGNVVVNSDGSNIWVDTQYGQNHNWYVSSQKKAGYHKDGYTKSICDTCGISSTTYEPMTHAHHHTQVVVKSTLTTGGVSRSVCACGLVLGEYGTDIKRTHTLYKGKSVTLKVGQAGKFKWTSSSKKVATVNKNGKVVAKKKGKTTITVKSGKKVIAKCVVTVKNPSLKVSKTSVTLKKEKSVKLNASTTPKATIKWSSSNKKIATVSSSGNIKAKKKGSCKIYVRANDLKKTIKVKVK